ncbi:DUF6179 domain-containing protein [Enterococcus sp. LJL99]
MKKELTYQINQYDVLTLLKKILLEKCGGTTSFSIEEAENVLQSIIFVLTFAKEKEVKDIEKLFYSGQQELIKKVADTKLLYDKVRKNALTLDVDAYQGTINAIETFFQTYDILHEAHEINSAWIDYQLAIPVSDREYQGILFIEKYLQHLFVENHFCQLFSTHLIDELFYISQKQLKMDYRKDVNNLYERIFLQVLAKLIAGQPDWSTLVLNKREFERLVENIEKISQRMIFEQLIQLLKEQKLLDVSYYKRTLDIVWAQIFVDRSENCLQHLVIIENSSKAIYLPNEGVTNKEFQVILKQANQSSESEKICLFRDKFVSIYDYLDLFDLEILTENELTHLFRKFSLEEMALLSKIIERNSGEQKLLWQDFLELDVQTLWEQQFIMFLTTIKDSEKQKLDDKLESFDLPLIDFD